MTYPTPRARVRRQTSIDAYLSSLPAMPETRRKIMAAIARAGLHGMTVDEATHATGIDLLTLRPTVTGLSKAGYLRDSTMRRLSDRGHTSIVWVITGL